MSGRPFTKLLVCSQQKQAVQDVVLQFCQIGLTFFSLENQYVIGYNSRRGKFCLFVIQAFEGVTGSYTKL